jgi:thiol:disulfide interchange protein DsbD
VWAAWDAAGVTMERKVWTDPRVEAAARPFVALRLDLTDAEGDAERYAERYEVTGLPVTILFDAHGRRTATLVGYQDPDRLASTLRTAAEE